MTLDIKSSVADLRKAYAEDPRQSSFNVLLLGETGSGKTFSIRTCRRPIHIDSFDPGGTKSVREEIAAGHIIADTRYESEDPTHPTEYEPWKKTFEQRLKNKYFDHFGTYVLDSATTWSDAIMNWVLKKAGIAGTAPRFTKDYTPQKVEIRNMLKKILSLPCDVILIGHLKLVEDPESGKHIFRFMTTGQGMVTIPLLFDEIYVMNAKTIGTKVAYQLLTKPTSRHLARSRLAGNGLFEAIEEPDFKKLMQKAGIDTTDKPKL